MTPAIWADIQDDLDAASRAARDAVAKSATLDAIAPEFREDREIAIGKHLHDAFSAAEKALQRMIAAVDDDLPVGRSFHRDLLGRAASALPGRRAAIIAAETATGLEALLRFRHAFRHAYDSYAFPRARENVALVATTIPRLRDEITAFAAGLGLAPRA